MDHPLDLSPVPAWESHLRTICEHFQKTSGGKCLLWVNPAQHDPIEDDALAAGRKVRVRIVHPRFDVD
jgi:hypothetical protein